MAQLCQLIHYWNILVKKGNSHWLILQIPHVWILLEIVSPFPIYNWFELHISIYIDMCDSISLVLNSIVYIPLLLHTCENFQVFTLRSKNSVVIKQMVLSDSIHPVQEFSEMAILNVIYIGSYWAFPLLYKQCHIGYFEFLKATHILGTNFIHVMLVSILLIWYCDSFHLFISYLGFFMHSFAISFICFSIIVNLLIYRSSLCIIKWIKYMYV